MASIEMEFEFVLLKRIGFDSIEATLNYWGVLGWMLELAGILKRCGCWIRLLKAVFTNGVGPKHFGAPISQRAEHAMHQPHDVAARRSYNQDLESLLKQLLVRPSPCDLRSFPAA